MTVDGVTQKTISKITVITVLVSLPKLVLNLKLMTKMLLCLLLIYKATLIMKSSLLVFCIFINCFFINVYAAKPDLNEIYPATYDKEDFSLSYIINTCEIFEISKLTPNSTLHIHCLVSEDYIIDIDFHASDRLLVENYRYSIKNNTHSISYNRIDFSDNFLDFSRLINNESFQYIRYADKIIRQQIRLK